MYVLKYLPSTIDNLRAVAVPKPFSALVDWPDLGDSEHTGSHQSGTFGMDFTNSSTFTMNPPVGPSSHASTSYSPFVYSSVTQLIFPKSLPHPLPSPASSPVIGKGFIIPSIPQDNPWA